jgi:Ca2+-binding EF-hand superfamily protein
MGRGGMARMMDTNGDGEVSKDEFIAMTLRRFDMMDTNHDGQLTKAEREAAFAAMRARMEERMRERMQSGAEMGGGDSGGGD